MTTLARELGFSSDQLQEITEKAFDLVEAGDLDGAVVIFNGLLTLNPTDAAIQAALGSVFHQQGKLSEARDAYDLAIALQGNTVLARVNRGDLRCKAGDLGGLEDLEIAARMPTAVQARAQALVRLYTR